MANDFKIKLELRTVEGTSARAPSAQVAIKRDMPNGSISSNPTIDRFELDFPPARTIALQNPGALGTIRLDVKADLFRPYATEAIMPQVGRSVDAKPATLLRDPKKWEASFTRFADLASGRFGALTRLLDASPNVQLLTGKKRFKPIGSFAGGTYDAPADDKTVLAKAALLNLYAKLRATTEPVDNAARWFDFVTELLVIGRERFIAVCKPEFAMLVAEIHDRPSRFPDYEPAPATLHDDWPPPFTVADDEKFSVKTKEDRGNLQLTFAVATDPSGATTVLLDADIDENGTFFEHLTDALIRHKITGGTHPFDIHEILTFQGERDLGYTLEPAD